MGSADFRIIRPVIVTDTSLISSTVPEAVVTEYVPGTTYVAGDIRGVTTGTAQDVYQSLQAGNMGNAPSTSPTWWGFLGRVYAAFVGGTSYAKDAIVTDLPNHQLYQSMIAANTSTDFTDKTKWLSLGATTRWKMFDKAVNSQTTAPNSVTTVISLNALVNTLGLLNLSGSDVTVAQSASGYTRTKSLVRHDVLNWYDWWYEEPVREGDAVFTDIPPYQASSLTITVNNPGDTAGIGCCILGKSRTIGQTAWDFTGGVLSYSTDTTDTFGNTTLVKRDNAKLLNFEVYITKGFESEVYRLLKQYTDTEMMIIGAEDYSMSLSYGYLGQWSIPVTNGNKTAHIEWRGLI